MKTVKLRVDWIRDSLLTNWKFGFVFDRLLHDLQRFVFEPFLFVF